jgi:hypothetical protein
MPTVGKTCWLRSGRNRERSVTCTGWPTAFRILHLSVQWDHVHLIVEASDALVSRPLRRLARLHAWREPTPRRAALSLRHGALGRRFEIRNLARGNRMEARRASTKRLAHDDRGVTPRGRPASHSTCSLPTRGATRVSPRATRVSPRATRVPARSAQSVCAMLREDVSKRSLTTRPSSRVRAGGFHAEVSTTRVISGGAPTRAGGPAVPKPRLM